MASLNLVVTAEERDFDPGTIQHFRDESFQVTYLPFHSTLSAAKDYEKTLHSLVDPLEAGEKYAIVAYGKAASRVLAEVVQSPMPKLSVLVCYYPDPLPPPATSLPAGVKIIIHLAGSQGLSTGYKSYLYVEAKPGFAGVDFESYDKVAAGLAWSRTLGLLRQGLGIEVDLEAIWDNHTELEFTTKDADATMSTMVGEPYVNHIPTSTGGIGQADLRRFYRDYFIPGNPPSLKMRLVSRTVGTDRVVDELFVSFRHTQVIPWMLPDIKPTDREVEVALVAIVCIRGGKLYHEHIYWDQATVLVQLGLLDPIYLRGKEDIRLPVIGADGARKVLNEKSVTSNVLISSW